MISVTHTHFHAAQHLQEFTNRINGKKEFPQHGFRNCRVAYFVKQKPLGNLDAENYAAFSGEAITRQLHRLADELDIKPADLPECLVHLRVGDFFGNRETAKKHVLERLSQVVNGSKVMTNDEDLLLDPKIATVMAERQVELVSTRDMTAEQVLRTMARYCQINANDSSLTFWSSVLAGGEVKLCDNRLRACHDVLVNYRYGH